MSDGSALTLNSVREVIATGFDFMPLPNGYIFIEFNGDDGKTINVQVVADVDADEMAGLVAVIPVPSTEHYHLFKDKEKQMNDVFPLVSVLTALNNLILEKGFLASLSEITEQVRKVWTPGGQIPMTLGFFKKTVVEGQEATGVVYWQPGWQSDFVRQLDIVVFCRAQVRLGAVEQLGVQEAWLKDEGGNCIGKTVQIYCRTQNDFVLGRLDIAEGAHGKYLKPAVFMSPDRITDPVLNPWSTDEELYEHWNILPAHQGSLAAALAKGVDKAVRHYYEQTLSSPEKAAREIGCSVDQLTFVKDSGRLIQVKPTEDNGRSENLDLPLETLQAARLASEHGEGVKVSLGRFQPVDQFYVADVDVVKDTGTKEVLNRSAVTPETVSEGVEGIAHPHFHERKEEMTIPENGWLEQHQKLLKSFGPRLVAALAQSGFPEPVGFICDATCPVGRDVMFVTSLARGLSEEEAAKGIELLIAQAALMGGALPTRGSTLEYDGAKEILEACGLVCPEWEGPNNYLIFVFAAGFASFQNLPSAEWQAWAEGQPSCHETSRDRNTGGSPIPFFLPRGKEMSEDCVLELAQAVRCLRAYKAGEITLDEAAKAIGTLHGNAKRDTTFDGTFCQDDYYVVFYGNCVNMHGKVQPQSLVVFKTLEKVESWWKLYGNRELPCTPYSIARTLLLELAELCEKHGMDVMVEK